MPLWMWLLLVAIIGLTITVIWFLFRPTITITIWMILLLALGFLLAGFYLAMESLHAGLIATGGVINPTSGTVTNAGTIAA
jgi:hypothetical protein